jgi:hypothetical protein
MEARSRRLPQGLSGEVASSVVSAQTIGSKKVWSGNQQHIAKASDYGRCWIWLHLPRAASPHKSPIGVPASDRTDSPMDAAGQVFHANLSSAMKKPTFALSARFCSIASWQYTYYSNTDYRWLLV